MKNYKPSGVEEESSFRVGWPASGLVVANFLAGWLACELVSWMTGSLAAAGLLAGSMVE